MEHQPGELEVEVKLQEHKVETRTEKHPGIRYKLDFGAESGPTLVTIVIVVPEEGDKRAPAGIIAAYENFPRQPLGGDIKVFVNDHEPTDPACFFCFKDAGTGFIPAQGWEFVFGSLVCPKCLKRLKEEFPEGGWADKVKAGAYCTRPVQFIVTGCRKDLVQNLVLGQCYPAEEIDLFLDALELVETNVLRHRKKALERKGKQEKWMQAFLIRRESMAYIDVEEKDGKVMVQGWGNVKDHVPPSYLDRVPRFTYEPLVESIQILPRADTPLPGYGWDAGESSTMVGDVRGALWMRRGNYIGKELFHRLLQDMREAGCRLSAIKSGRKDEKVGRLREELYRKELSHADVGQPDARIVRYYI